MFVEKCVDLFRKFYKHDFLKFFLFVFFLNKKWLILFQNRLNYLNKGLNKKKLMVVAFSFLPLNSKHENGIFSKKSSFQCPTLGMSDVPLYNISY